MDFFNERLILRNDISVNFVENFISPQKDFQKKSKINAENNSVLNLISNEVFFKFVNEALLNYPNLNKELFDEKDLEKLKIGLPNLKNVDEASKDKKYIVYEYINLLVLKDIEKLAKDYLKSSKGAKVNYVLNPTEIACRNSDPISANSVASAAQYAKDYTLMLYGNNNDSGAENSFLHSFWNALAVRFVCVQTYKKWKGLEKTKKFTCAHEYHPTILNQKLYTPQGAMDLHNNLVGRTYMYERVGQTWLGTANNIPDIGKISSDLFAMQKLSQIYQDPPTNILGLSTYYNWNSLEDYNSGMDYNTSYISPFTKEKLVYLISQ